VTVPNDPIRCTVVSPERPLFEGHAEHIVVPALDGEMGIYARHAPLVGALGSGIVRIHRQGGVERYAIRGGFVHVKKNVVTLAVTDAVLLEDADRAALEAEYASVREALQHPRSTEEYDELMTRRRWCEVRLGLMDKASDAPAH
jgi:F-type H+-transporting ATPase subunit epsilon